MVFKQSNKCRYFRCHYRGNRSTNISLTKSLNTWDFTNINISIFCRWFSNRGGGVWQTGKIRGCVLKRILHFYALYCSPQVRRTTKESEISRGRLGNDASIIRLLCCTPQIDNNMGGLKVIILLIIGGTLCLWWHLFNQACDSAILLKMVTCFKESWNKNKKRKKKYSLGREKISHAVAFIVAHWPQ